MKHHFSVSFWFLFSAFSCSPIFLASSVRGSCTFSDQTGFKADDGTGPSDFKPGKDLSQCKQLCLADNTCVALDVRSNACRLYNTVPGPTSGDASTTYAEKVCTQGCSTTTQSDTTGGSDNVVELDAASSDSCRALCRVIDACSGATFLSSSCSLYTSSATTSSSGAQHFQKTTCDDGRNCCFMDISGTQGSGTADLVFSATSASCKNLCEQANACQAATFRDGKCYLYGASTSTSTLSGSTHFQKSCPADSSFVGTLVSCNSATRNAAAMCIYTGLLILLFIHVLIGA